MTSVSSAKAYEIVNEYRKRFAAPGEKAPSRSNTHRQIEPEHELVLTCPANKRGNGKILVVRCKCMAEYRSVSRRYYNYDPLGEVTSLADAIALYQQHLTD